MINKAFTGINKNNSCLRPLFFQFFIVKITFKIYKKCKVFELYNEEVKKGRIDSIYKLGNCYQCGMGTEKNEAKAFELYDKAAENDHLISIYLFTNYI